MQNNGFALLILVCKIVAVSTARWPAVVNKAAMFNVKLAMM